LDELSVLDFFNTILGREARFRAAQEWLISMNFLSVALQQMRVLEQKDPRGYGFYRLLNVREKADVIVEHFCVAATVSVLSVKSEQYEDDRWDTVAAIYRPAIRDPMRSFWAQAVQVLSEEITVVARRHVAALLLITKIIRHDRGMREFFPGRGNSAIVTRLFVSFPDHSILLFTIKMFMKTAMCVSKIAAELVPIFVPAAIKASMERTSPTGRAFAFVIMNAIRKLAVKSPKFRNILIKVPAFTKFIIENRDRYTVVKMAYGGEIESEKGAERRPLCAD
jgi:hypothetical protein